MTRRRHHERAAPPPPFAGAVHAIDKMEEAVVYRTVTCDFTLMDAIHWLWPDHIVSALTVAHAFARSKQSHIIETTISPMVPFVGSPAHPRYSLYFSLDAACMLAPAPGMWRDDLDPGHPVVAALKEVTTIHNKFNTVRDVVTWLNTNASPGAARFHFPPITALLPPEHPVQRSDGQRYKETLLPISDIAPLVRQACSVVASGLLAEPNRLENNRTLFGVQAMDEEAHMSQRFMLL